MHPFAAKVVTTFYRRLYICAKPIDLIVDGTSNAVTGIRVLTLADVDVYTRQGIRSAEIFKARIQNGHQCFALFNNDQVIHSGWAATGTAYIQYLNRTLVLQPGDIYQYDTYTVPEYRKYGLANMRNAYVLRHYAQQGFSRSLGSASLENVAGWKALQAVKYTFLGIYHYLRLGPLQHHWQQQLTSTPLPQLVK